MPAPVDFVEFMEQRQQPLLRFAMVLSGNSRLAEDVVADVLTRAYELWPRIGQLDQPNAYIRRMIVNEYLSWRRRTDRTTAVNDVEEHGDHTSEPGPDHAIGHAERSAMLAALDKLPRKQRATLVLRFYEGMSDAEVAEVFGCSQSTVRSNAARALSALRIQFGGSQPPSRLSMSGEL